MTVNFEGDELNERAFYAVRHGLSRSVAGDLIALLRSGVAIAPEVREAMAVALEAGIVGGKGGGVSITVSGNLHGSLSAETSDAENDALRIIKAISALLETDTDLSGKAAIRLAAPGLNKGVGTCEEYWFTLRPIYLEHLAHLDRGIMGASLDQDDREYVAMSFAYRELQKIRRERRPPPRGIRSA